MTDAASDGVGPSSHPLILASRVNGTTVLNQTGDKIGHIDDLSIEKVSGKVIYAIMSFGGFLGIGEHFHPVPWSLLNFDAERDGYVVPLDKAALEAAPYYDRDELAKLGGDSHLRYADTIYGFYATYGVVPFWP